MGPLLLSIAALIWGATFVAQKVIVDHLGPFTVTCIRNIIGGVFVYFCFRMRLRFLGRIGIPPNSRSFSVRSFCGGAASGVALFAASLMQQIGIAYTSPGISAFLTSNYIILVPIFGLFIGRRATALAWVWALMALAGTCLLCVEPNVVPHVGKGEIWTMVAASLFAIQVLCIDRFAPGTDILAFSCVQQFTGALCALPFLALQSERVFFTAEHFAAAAPPLFVIAILSSGIAYTLQNLGQLRTPPTLATIIMSLESAIGALSGFLILGDPLSPRQLLGCSVMLLAVILSQIVRRK